MSILEKISKKISFVWYYIWCWACWVFCLLLFKPLFYNRKYIPKKGGFLLLSNHQCFLDPMLNASPIRRQCCFAARDSLFRVPIFGPLFHSFNAIPVRRGEADMTAMRAFIEKLQSGMVLVLYPEGTRTSDGKIAEIKPGFGLLARKANVPVVPSVIDGGYECWPKTQGLFQPGNMYVTYGSPIPVEHIKAIGDRAFAKELTKILRQMQAELRTKVGKEPFDYSLNC
ncbi:MAG: 1-acyl-sn-glycerol-3-phosphate acyltransferase [Anaerohalosphaeraceae bacterium]|nr:1-acyl-sn-glycerol-3-phosphate acyltransferase [Anaerohalosphaeraceae bacterium]